MHTDLPEDLLRQHRGTAVLPDGFDAFWAAQVAGARALAAYNACEAEKEIVVHLFNGHEGGGPEDTAAALRFLADRLGGTGGAPRTAPVGTGTPTG